MWQPTLQAGSSTLQLNGAGVRRQGSGGFYAAGLYLDQKLSTAEAVLGHAGAKQLRVVMLRATSAAEMGDLLARGAVANASDEELSRLAPMLFRLGEILGSQQQLAAGDSFQIDWQPGLGTAIRINGQQRGEPFREPEALLAPPPRDLRPVDGAGLVASAARAAPSGASATAGGSVAAGAPAGLGSVAFTGLGSGRSS